MIEIENLKPDNCLLYAVKMYTSPKYITSEFEEDYLRFKYIRRLIRKYKTKNDLKERLLLNHIIVLGNVFGVEATVRLLFLKNDERDYDTLKTFLIFLGYMPEIVKNINSKTIISADIPIDAFVSESLRTINEQRD